MRRNLLETVMGGVVLAVAAFFLVFAWSQADLGTVQGYGVKAAFQSVGGLANGADVQINGIKVGTVLDQTIDPSSFNADVRMSISPAIHLPADSTATIDSSGLLGDKLVKVIPGKSKQMLPTDGSAVIANTKPYKSIEQQVSEIIFLATDSGKPAGGSGGGDATPAPAPDTPNAPAGDGEKKP
jgi:phospholipid/cholesterol/gamma-HCH transport system substrate-binding protein